MSDGSYIVGFFNRDDKNRSFELALSTIGLEGTYKVRDLWRHADIGSAQVLSATLPPHACKIMKLTK